MQNFAQFILGIFKFHKLKVATFIASFIAFGILLFPFADIGDFASVKVAELTQNQVFLQFDDLGFSVIPQPGIEFTNVTVESAAFPKLKAKSVSMAPSIPALLTLKPGASLHAEGLFGGGVSVSFRGGEKTPAGGMKQLVQISTDQVELKSLVESLDSPILPTGKVNASVDGEVDPQFKEQPQATVKLNLKNFKLPESSIATPIGPLLIPELGLAIVDIKGQLRKGKLTIESGKIGESKDDLSGTISGQVDLNISSMGGQLSVVPGPYDLNVDITPRTNFLSRAQLLFVYFEACKKEVAGVGSRFNFRAHAQSTATPAKIDCL